MVCDWYRVFVDAKKSIADNGLTYKNSHGTIVRNPAFTALSTSSTQIQQILRSFAANPYQKSKMKSLDPEVRREDDYIRSIMEN
jgi:phage terminase small subunit